MNHPRTLRVLIGDDHRIVREGLKQVLAEAEDIAVVAEATTGDEVLAQVRAAGAGALDAVLLDIALPGRDGLDVLQSLKREQPDLPVLMLSTYPEGYPAHAGIDLFGAHESWCCCWLPRARGDRPSGNGF